LVSTVGGNVNFVYARGETLEAYDKAFIAVVEGEERLKQFINALLKRRNI